VAATLGPQQYVAQKRDILTRCLRLTEDIHNALGGDPDALEGLIDRRMGVISEFQALEGSVDDALRASCPKGELDSLDGMLRVILSFDEKTEATLRKMQIETLESMKSNTQKQRFTQYETVTRPMSGRLMDKKE
jgi:hypothetical protein